MHVNASRAFIGRALTLSPKETMGDSLFVDHDAMERGSLYNHFVGVTRLETDPRKAL